MRKLCVRGLSSCGGVGGGGTVCICVCGGGWVHVWYVRWGCAHDVRDIRGQYSLVVYGP